ncbi:hypothetical protein HLK59_14405 [Streptomyces sp. S3(2020)]|uniref:hypothetical protein n=1 Tax=Streptomyces sp. S3(2020) TaxID=2732044 RepID=UPI001487E3B3|nr:hypothetical protein [Streptomyces sp. S3(2020)]NNN31534.1 hypothetical protein [Streptomyces sp. S3(2020)]
MSSTRTWLRAFVLLLALLVPGAHSGAHAAIPVTSVTSVAAGEAAEYDVLDTALRPPARAAHRPVASPRTAPAPGVPAVRPLPKPPHPSYAPHILRSVVLRC